MTDRWCLPNKDKAIIFDSMIFLLPIVNIPDISGIVKTYIAKYNREKRGGFGCDHLCAAVGNDEEKRNYDLCTDQELFLQPRHIGFSQAKPKHLHSDTERSVQDFIL